MWVLESSKIDKVFKYTVSGTYVGSWTISTSGATSPTGITLDPSNVSHLWIVDSGTDRVYQYNNAATLTSGSKSADSSFALAAGNTNPQGIADPPAPSDMQRLDTRLGGDVLPAQSVLNEQAVAVADALFVSVGDVDAATGLPGRPIRVATRPLAPALAIFELPADKEYFVGTLAQGVSDARHHAHNELGPRHLDDLFAEWDDEPLGMFIWSGLGL